MFAVVRLQRVGDNAFHLKAKGGSASPKTMALAQTPKAQIKTAQSGISQWQPERQGGSASPKTMPYDIAEGAIKPGRAADLSGNALRTTRSTFSRYKPRARDAPQTQLVGAYANAERVDIARRLGHQSMSLRTRTRCEWRIPVRATQARCAKIPAIVMVIGFRHILNNRYVR
jgi:hypothetical protein